MTFSLSGMAIPSDTIAWCHAAAGGSFTLLRFAEPELQDVVYIEQLTRALYLDDRQDIDHYLDVMNER